MTVRGCEVAEVGAVEAVTQGEAGHGGPAEVEVRQPLQVGQAASTVLLDLGQKLRGELHLLTLEDNRGLRLGPELYPSLHQLHD